MDTLAFRLCTWYYLLRSGLSPIKPCPFRAQQNGQSILPEGRHPGQFKHHAKGFILIRRLWMSTCCNFEPTPVPSMHPKTDASRTALQPTRFLPCVLLVISTATEPAPRSACNRHPSLASLYFHCYIYFTPTFKSSINKITENQRTLKFHYRKHHKWSRNPPKHK